MSSTWRLIETPPCDGRDNMAIDEALFRSFDQNFSLPVLRLYGWNPPALSIGRFQKVQQEIDCDACESDGLLLVRRITGGGAIFHADEITYSLVCSQKHIPDASGVKDSFRILTSFLLEFYSTIGLQPRYASENPSITARLGERTPLCFAGKESYDITIGSRKIGGNAQRRSRDLIFQHGSIPLLDNLSAANKYMKVPPQNVETSATSLHSEGVNLKSDRLLEIIREQFALRMGVTLISSELTESEEKLYRDLCQTKYASKNWNIEGKWNEDSTQA